MILSAKIYHRGTRIDYSYDTVRKDHTVWLADPAKLTKGSAGMCINTLCPYRENGDVKELIQWLATF